MFVLIPESIPGGRHFSCEVASSNFGEKLWASELSSDFDQGQMTSNLYKFITFCWRCWKSESFVIQLPLACRHCFSPEKHFRGSCFEHLVQFFIVASPKNCNFMITLKSPWNRWSPLGLSSSGSNGSAVFLLWAIQRDHRGKRDSTHGKRTQRSMAAWPTLSWTQNSKFDSDAFFPWMSTPVKVA
jgi:hypothetical protein